jgi:hypothetical protein
MEESAGQYVHIHRKVLKDVRDTLRHAKVFIATREKMHPDGQHLYDDVLKSVEALVGN